MLVGKPVTIDDPRDTFLFEAFSDDQLSWLADHAEAVQSPAGERIVTEGEDVDALWVLLDGELQVARTVRGRETTMATGTTPGTWAGGLPVFDGPSQVTARTLRPSRLPRIPRQTVRELLAGGFPVADHLMAGITYGIRNFEATARQQEKLAALGKLSAGLPHELNNPAAAARRATERLQASLHDRDQRTLALGRQLDDDQVALLASAAARTDDGPAAVIGLSPLDRSDREDGLIAWLDTRDVDDGYDLAAALVEAGLTMEDLDPIADQLDAAALPAALTWLGGSLTVDALAAEIEQSVGSISDLVRAVKDDSYMDQAPRQEVNIHAGLDSTLQILAYELRGVTVARDYAAELLIVWADGGELNHVWTNLLDNAIVGVKAAAPPEPQITIRTAREEQGIVVAITDNGTGIPPELSEQIFEPFFTTKSVDEDTGLDLDISYRIVVRQHEGDPRFRSSPGETTFRVWLPSGEQAAQHQYNSEASPPDSNLTN